MDWKKTVDVTKIVTEFAQEFNVPVCTLITTSFKKTISPGKGVSKKKVQEIFIFGRDDENKKIIAMRELQKRLDSHSPCEFLVKVDKGRT